MISISVKELSKKFNKNLLFQNLNFTLNQEEHLVILGHNGSGKSSLLKCLMFYNYPSLGEVVLTVNQKVINLEQIAKNIAVATPYLSLEEDLTFKEILDFQQRFKPLKEGFSSKEILELSGLEKHSKKRLKSFSSGMKQRVKLSLAIFFDTPFLFLDEPCSNLDAQGVAWYQEILSNHLKNRIAIVCSNQNKEEFFFAKKSIDLGQKQPQIVELN